MTHVYGYTDTHNILFSRKKSKRMDRNTPKCDYLQVIDLRVIF